ncbi:hypothetical protein FSP39_003409 [Pinctada imbricata]|uniref:Zinc transporter ZIP1 n=1 Tax=Pinctada imbricata TaxID=66713 RepID=A0AA88YBS5_PINIB|nr:hypothetical protein FSP39_003409 [Pinctada imbricata]
MTFIFGLLPFVMIKCLNKTRFSKQRIKYFISLLNCLSGGVFFGTAILHLLPEATEQIEEYIEADYPVASALVGAGFLLVLSVEHIIGACNGDQAHFHGHCHGSVENGHQNQALNVDDNLDGSAKKTQTKISPTPGKDSSVTGISYIKTSSAETAHLPATFTGQPTSEQGLDANSHEPNVTMKTNNAVNTGNYDENKVSRLRTIILVLALSLHMIFEGLAVGLQETNQEVWKLVGILTLHKCIVAFSTGLQLEETLHSFKKVLLLIIGFSFVAPLGVGIGFLVTEYGGEGQAQGISSGVLQSMATGTFFYITFFEILQKELANSYNLLKVLFTVVGFTVVIGLQFLPDDD